MNEHEPKMNIPPRLRDWKSGTPQVAIFIRTAQGGVIKFVANRASLAVLHMALATMAAGQRRAAVRAAYLELVRG